MQGASSTAPASIAGSLLPGSSESQPPLASLPACHLRRFPQDAVGFGCQLPRSSGPRAGETRRHYPRRLNVAVSRSAPVAVGQRCDGVQWLQRAGVAQFQEPPVLEELAPFRAVAVLVCGLQVLQIIVPAKEHWHDVIQFGFLGGERFAANPASAFLQFMQDWRYEPFQLRRQGQRRCRQNAPRRFPLIPLAVSPQSPLNLSMECVSWTISPLTANAHFFAPMRRIVTLPTVMPVLAVQHVVRDGRANVEWLSRAISI